MKTKNIEDYNNYSINENGEIMNLSTGRILKHSKNQKGYHFVILSKGGFSKTFSVHRTVYKMFKGELVKGFEINHIDGNKSNNNIENLEQITKVENMFKAVELGLIKSGEKCPFSVSVIQINPATKEVVNKFGSISIASKKTKIQASAISLAVNNKRKTAGKFIWIKNL